MLDLSPLVAPAREAARRARERRALLRDAVATAVTVAAPDDPERFAGRVRASRTSWLAAHPLDGGTPGRALSLPDVPAAYAVAAADGSQVAPDPRQDGDFGCVLVHVGRVLIAYGDGAPRPRLDARAAVLLTEDDEEDDGAEDGGRLSRTVGLRRFAREMRELAVLIAEAAALGLPAVALTDGSLIAWQLEDETGDDPAKQEAIAALLGALDAARAAGVPLVGYVSAPGSRDVVNGLRVGALCPEEPADCRRCPHPPNALPCSPIRAATDAALFASLLPSPGDRSPVFAARGQATGYSRVLKMYGQDHWVGFFYLNAGPEVARVELPLWAAQDPALLARIHAVCWDQARKGRGYPVALAEAHERAVVRGADRQAFLSLLTRALVAEGTAAGGAPTRKALAKRTRGV
jgi:hypothetical protein